MAKFFAECISRKDNSLCTVEIVAATKEDAIEEIKSELDIVRIENAKGKHICKYCGSIVEGTNEDILCEECIDVFGHHRYSEL